MRQQDAYATHFPIRRKFKRNRVMAIWVDESWMADLVDLQPLAKDNQGYRYLLTVIDVLSKYAWAIPIKNKNGSTVTKAFKDEIIEIDQRKPEQLYTDQGKEFLNRDFKAMTEAEQIHHVTSTSDMKASVVERFNRTLKSRMWKYFTAYGTRKYIDELSDIVAGYNHSWHRAIKMKPVDVNKRTFRKAWKNLYGEQWPGYVPNKHKEKTTHRRQRRADKRGSTGKFKFDIGDLVKISRVKKTFDKGYVSNWTKEIFGVDKRIARNPPVYKLFDENGGVIDGIFYEPELLKVYLREQPPVEPSKKKRSRKKTKQ
ncbi:MAG: transposase family protein [Gammaproteobacteria bacterium]|nr:transposase family protein [Gammaproteobacteria bacterium]